MSKFIQLGNGPFIPANTIRKITGPYSENDSWYYVVSYEYCSDIVFDSKTFVEDEYNAKLAMGKFVDRLNELL